MHYLPCSGCASSSLKPRHEVWTLNEALVELHTGCLQNILSASATSLLLCLPYERPVVSLIMAVLCLPCCI